MQAITALLTLTIFKLLTDPMKRLLSTLLLCACFLFSHSFTAGNIVVLRVGDGSTALSSSAAPVYLDEYTVTGTFVGTTMLPTVDNGNNQTFTISGSATSEGSLALSGNNQYLTLAGYDAAPSTANVATATGINRVVARIDGAGNINTSTMFTLDSAYKNNSIRGAYTLDGSAFWCSGNGSGNTGGTFYLPLGGGNGVQVSASPANTRWIKGFNNQLYTSSASGTFQGISAVGTGMPTTSGQTTTILPGFSTTAGPSINGFVLFDLNPSVPGPDVIYVADDRTTAPDGGIYKYSLVGGTWVSNGNITSSDPLRGLTGLANCSQVSLATTSEGAIYGLQDNTGYNGTISATLTPMATAGTNKKFRGVSLTPGTVAPSALTATISSVTNVNCYGNSNGAATVSVNGNTGSPSYVWSNGATIFNPTNLAAGTYIVTVTDQVGCSDTAAVTVTQPGQIVVTPTTTNVSCNGGANGSISLTVSGGTSGYTYHWYDNTSASSHSSLSTGNYAVTITDAHSCTATASISVSQPSAINVTGQTTNPSCAGTSTGAVNVTTSGGTNPYSYNWSNGATTEDLSSLAAGTYILTATDNHQCSATSSFTLSAPAAITGTAQVTNASCGGGNNGAINLTPGGGNGAPYAFTWSNNLHTEDLNGLAGGNYSVTITDNGSCSASFSFTVGSSGSLAINAQQTNVQCNGNNNGSITTAPSGGATPYTYSWNTGSTNSSLNNLTAGNYTLTVSDNSGCQVTGSYTITEPSALNVTGNVTDVTCNGASNGSISINVSGGTGPYSYNWNDANSNPNRTNLNAGSYAVTVTDAHNCTALYNTSVTQPAALALTLTPTDATTINGTDGSVSASTTGGTGGVSYFWNNSSTSQNITGLSAGNYCVTATDANGCSASACANVDQPVGINEASNVSNVQTLVQGGTLTTIITLQKAETLHFQVMNLNGQLLYTDTKQVNGNAAFNVPVTEWAAGFYLVRITGSGKPVTQKITLQ